MPANAQKAEVRAEIQARLERLNPDQRPPMDMEIFGRVISTMEFQCAQNVFLYHSSVDEPDTKLLIDTALSADKNVGLPRIIRSTHGMQVVKISDREADLNAGYAGLMEPREGLPEMNPSELNWILLPGRAFDLSGNRLGRGAGHYDRWLAKAALDPKIVLVALAYEVQILAQIPTEPHDRKVDWIITEKRIIKAQ